MTTKIICHESTHAAMQVFSEIDAIPDLENQEPFAYLCGYIADCCYEAKIFKASDKTSLKSR